MTNTISTTLTNGIILNFGSYGSQLSITTSGDVAPTAEGATGLLANVPNDSIYNAGRISGGAGHYHQDAAGGNGGAGVVLQGFDIGLTNQGTILGGQGGVSEGSGGNGGAGVSLAGGTVTNDGRIDGGAGGSGFIAGAGGAGIYFNGGTVINAGTIAGGASGDDGAAGDAVQFGALAGTLIIDPGAVFIGNVVADARAADVLVLASAATAGTISLLGDQFTGFSTLIEDAGANWIFTGSNTLEGTVVLEGTISGDGNVTVTGQLINDETIRLDTGLTLTGMLTNRGAISGENGSNGEDTGGNGGVAIYMNAGLLINGGTIGGGHGGYSNSFFYHGGKGGAGVHLAGGTLTNQQTIDGGEGGEGASGGAGGAGVAMSGGVLTNEQTINGGAGGYGFYNYGGAGGAGVAISGGSLTNSGTINGGGGGIASYDDGAGGVGVAMSGGALTNNKMIDGGAGGAALNTGGAGGAGVYFNGGTLTNAGTIAGGAGGSGFESGAAGDAVQFGASAGTLIIDPGAVFIGNVVADSNAADVLVLASAATAGTISLLGSQFTGFSTLIEDAGANWIFTGSNTLEGTILLEGTISGDGNVTVTGQLINDETIRLDTGLTLTGMLTNRGAISGENGSNGESGGVAIYMNAGLLINGGTISGGDGSDGSDVARRAGNGGAGVHLAGGTLTNQQTVDGGEGGESGDGGAGGAGVAISGGSLTNSGTINGGAGGYGSYGYSYGRAGGAGIAISGGSLTNSGTINGGAGGEGEVSGAGGAGVAMSGGVLTNEQTINGGAGGHANYAASDGAGGAGIAISGGSLTNSGTINGGAGGPSKYTDGAGGVGVAMSGGALTNNKMIDGGAGGATKNTGGTGGAGGAGVYFNGGTLTNAGTIAGGAGGTGSHAGAAGDAVQFGAASGTLIIDPGAVFIGNVVADSKAADVLVLASAGSAGTLSGIGTQFTGFSTLDFAANSRWIVEGSAAGFASLQTIDGFSNGDTIVLDGFADNPADTTYVTGVGLELTDTSGNEVTLHIVEPAGATTGNFTVTDPQAETTITYTACFAAGTRLLRADGRLARVEDLAVGDALERFDGAAAPIRWIGVRTLDLRRHPRPADVQPILIMGGALGSGLPWRDLVVSPDHAMYFQGHLIPAKALLNGFTIRQLKRTHVTYYHVELPSHAVIFAEGAAAESYLESGNRAAFENGGAPVTLHPDFANSLRLAKSCAPFVEDGPVVEAVRADILRRADIATTDDPAWSIRYENGAAIIASRAAVPGEMFADPRDRRRLGVKVARLEIAGKTVKLDHPALCQGWHDVEPDGRWTDGRAIIPPGLIPIGAQVAINLAATLRYPTPPAHEIKLPSKHSKPLGVP